MLLALVPSVFLSMMTNKVFVQRGAPLAPDPVYKWISYWDVEEQSWNINVNSEMSEHISSGLTLILLVFSHLWLLDLSGYWGYHVTVSQSQLVQAVLTFWHMFLIHWSTFSSWQPIWMTFQIKLCMHGWTHKGGTAVLVWSERKNGSKIFI